MKLTITPGPLLGTVKAIPSKSEAHRLLILAALADAPTEIILSQSSADIECTLSCLQALGAGVSRSPGRITVDPVARAPHSPQLHCGESGSTLRFVLPLAAAFGRGGDFHGSGRLPERPLSELIAVMKKRGVTFSQERLPFTITGKLRPGEYVLPGDVSSQYLTGLLLALPRLTGDSVLQLTSELQSSAYVEMTLAALRRFGITVLASGRRFEIPGGQKYISPGVIGIEGDWSSAAFFLVAGALGGPVAVTGLDPHSCQGDKEVLSILERFGASVERCSDGAVVSAGKAAGLALDVSEIPDLLPVLAAAAASARGTTIFSGGKRLRFKESDRLTSTAAMINSLGGSARELSGGLVIEGGSLTGGRVDSFRDHRIAMAAAVAAIGCSGPVVIDGAAAVEKSYPRFFTDYLELGGVVDGISIRQSP